MAGALTDLRVIGLEVENVKRVKLARITPAASGVVEVSGANRQGKSSVLDSIEMAISGGRSIPWKPIRDGEETATIRLDLGNDQGLQLKLKRTFTSDGTEHGFATRLTVTNAEGFKPPGAQTLLNSIVNGLSFDPEAFMSASDAEQVTILQGLVPSYDFSDAAARRKKAFEARTDAGREMRRAQAASDSIEVAHGTPVQEVDTSAILAEMRAASDRRTQAGLALADWQRRADQVSHLDGSATASLTRAAALRRQADAIEEEARILQQRVREENDALGVAPGLPAEDMSEIETRFRNADATNREVAALRRKTDLAAEARQHAAAVDTCEAEMIAIDRSTAEAIALAQLPVNGLEIRDGRVMLRGVPFSQASTAEAIRASLLIGMAMNPHLRVIRIRQGALLDNESWSVIEAAAEGNDFQVWVETITPHNLNAIIMEEGTPK